MTNLKALREECGKTRKEVAAVLGVSIQAISNYESGNRRLSIEQILPLAQLYDVTTEEIIDAAVNSYYPSAQ